MLRGLDAAASGMIANQARQDALTNNLANVNTPGYKSDNSTFRTFPELLLERIRDTNSGVAGLPALPGPKQVVGRISHGVYNQELVPNFIQGDITETGKVLDVALVDEGLPTVEVDGKQVQPRMFFAIHKPGENGELQTYYTRSGNWSMNAQGQLTTIEGYPVLDINNRPINLRALLGDAPLNKSNLQLTPGGQLIAPGNPNAAPVQLGIYRVNNPAANLVKEADTAFRYSGNGAPTLYNPMIDSSIVVKQGYVERSNVDAGRTMIDLMTVLRSYESNQRVLQAYDMTLQKLNEVGKI
ncbi:flagellar hook-basal body protein [Aneurinibacillus aneurinilyticus]|uniref:Flagellar hook-basal body protein n=1 Tax=Aneurinibacillus aneurinilyticus ATCC 12856 TaxID=649747 RepID=U1Y4E7_ANEAE|nr:flagellar hook-basal body protein [Aneurinibacillus aneurinilyticus]ERI07062.1 flagellar hook-basal body protein [Aneurinibacillus aneurinilyticus ATCC 12856]MED0706401.1 flagellar hook-basal body protein [Aneurinibacillus aneurinilyticus]MED0723675.1 flagellar hook-basal body protein [Aneurinibacillus aneurinilyticus]MED0730643.1 flagellar hook-basal body protein [Aneurinibacillus aneurinilyticus]MED0741027.1 flagellar hook-basal body protein [Aneurinibacillus aneurinilyticus]